jgi:hypothetical protein
VHITTNCQSGYCKTCYMAAIERLCDGYAVPLPDGKRALMFPPLDPRLAAYVRAAAKAHAAAHGPGDTARHPAHAGVRS